MSAQSLRLEDVVIAIRPDDMDEISVHAVAHVSYLCNPDGTRRIERLRSAGLYGIEADADPQYHAEMIDEQLDDLRAHLSVFGVPCPDETWHALAAEAKDKARRR